MTPSQRIRIAEAEAQALTMPPSKQELEADYHLWLSYLLPKHFRSAGPEQFAPHHEKFLDWGWAIERDTLPERPACLWIVNRGGNKSTSAAGLAVALGAMQKRKFGLVITRTETQGDTHVGRVNSMLLASRIGSVYPGMTRPQLRKLENREQRAAWNRTMLTTADGWTLQNFSIEAALRGVGLEEYRPDFYWITDIDDERDSPGRVDTLLSGLANSVFGAQSADAVVVFDQNLIHRDSALNRIHTRKTDVLSDRLTIGPVPAVRDAKYKREHEHWSFQRGKVTWSGLPLPACEAILNKVGMIAWEREYQHNVNLAYADAVYSMWDEVYHVITWDEFAAFFNRYGVEAYDEKGQPRLPALGNSVFAQDWGFNPKHPCANRWCWRPAEGMPLTDSLFFYREMCWPRFPLVEDDDRRRPAPVKVAKEIIRVEKKWGETNQIEWRIASHERPEIVEAYATDLPLLNEPSLMFTQIKTAQAREGILHMQDFLTLIDDEPHPFSYHPLTGESLDKRPRAYFVVANGQGEKYWDESLSQIAVRPALNEAGMARTRWEYPNYRKPDTAKGTETKDPQKRDDDMCDVDRAIAGRLCPTVVELTKEQRIQQLYARRLDRILLKARKENAPEGLLASIIQSNLIREEAALAEANDGAHYLDDAY